MRLARSFGAQPIGCTRKSWEWRTLALISNLKCVAFAASSVEVSHHVRQGIVDSGSSNEGNGPRCLFHDAAIFLSL